MFLKKLLGRKPDPLDLHPTAGEIYGQVFENPVTGIKRDLFWNARVDFRPVILGGEQQHCSLAFEWMTWPVRRWHDLDGMSLRELLQPDLIECSLYLFHEHQPATLPHLDLREHGRNAFEANFSAVAEADDGRGRRLFNVSGRCDLRFIGIIIVPSNLQPGPTSASEAEAAAAEFLDLDGLREPRSEQWRYVLDPII